VSRHRVVIVGGGFGGLSAARALAGAPVDLTLVDRRNFHLFQPLLYQVATGGLSPAEICAPLRAVLARQANAEVRLDEVVAVDPARRLVRLAHGELGYDTLIVAAGSTHHYFGHDDWAEHAPGLKSIEDATRIRGRVLAAFEEAEREPDPARRERLLTFAVVGAGPTGVELAGAVAELARFTLRDEFRRIDPRRARIVLVDAAPRVLPPFPERLSAAAARSLAALGVELRLETRVVAVDAEAIELQRGGEAGGRERLAVGTVLWASGVRTVPLAAQLAAALDVELDRGGRFVVEPDLTLAGHPEIFVLGDMASLAGRDGKPLPGIAPVAMQQGRYAGRSLARRLAGRPIEPFVYRDKGQLAVIGRAAAVADLPSLRISGYPAWLLWLFVHILYLVDFANRLIVLFEWGYSYFTRRRGARLITGEAPRENDGLTPAGGAVGPAVR